jgi:hypothetical protein
LTVTPSSATPGDQLRVDWTSESQALQGPRHFGDWIGLFRVGDSNFDPISDLGISGSSGTLMWLAPGQPGQYEFRYFVGGVGIGGDDLEAARSHPVTVAGNVAVGAVTSAPLRAPRR